MQRELLGVIASFTPTASPTATALAVTCSQSPLLALPVYQKFILALLFLALFALLGFVLWRDRDILTNYKEQFVEWYNEVRGLKKQPSFNVLSETSINLELDDLDQSSDRSEGHDYDAEANQVEVATMPSHDPDPHLFNTGQPLDPNGMHFSIDDEQEELHQD